MHPRRAILALTALLVVAPTVPVEATAPVAAEPAPVTAAAPSAFRPDPLATWTVWVDQQYADLLGRAPTATERTNTADALADGMIAPGSVVASLRTSFDHASTVDPAVRLYRAFFLRLPDTGGFDFWVARRRTGTWPLVRIADHFAGSNEFQNRYGTLTHRAFVGLVYANVLGRLPDPGGLDFWTRQLEQRRRSRGHLMAGFSESNEFRTKQAASTTTAVLFLSLLRRPPTPVEHDAVTGALGDHLTVAHLAANVLDDHEYHGRFRPEPAPPRLITRSSDGSAADAWSSLGSMTGDGRFVVFSSNATNLTAEVPVGPAGRSRLYLWERFTGITLLEAQPPGTTGEVDLLSPTISDDGRFVSYLVWTSSSSAPGPHVHLLDRQTGAIALVTAPPLGGPADQVTWQAKISGDGHHVAFIAANVDHDSDTDVFSWERATGTTIQVSTTPEGGDPDEASGDVSISGDGRFIAFTSGATDLDPDHVSRGFETFVWDRTTGRSTQISVPEDPTAEPGPWFTTSPRISDDGRTVLYQSNAPDLVPGDRSGLTDLLLWDRDTGTTVQVNDDADAGHAEWVGYWAALSGDGRRVAHQAGGASLDPEVPGLAAWSDLEVWHRATGGRTTALAAPAAVVRPFALAEEMTMSRDGSALVAGTSHRLTAADTNDHVDIYLLHP